MVFEAMNYLFKLCHSNNLNLPVFEDMFGLTFVDQALGLKYLPNNDKFFLNKTDKLNSPMTTGVSNLQQVSMMLGFLQDYECLDNNFMLSNAVICSIKLNVPGLHQFLEARLIKPVEDVQAVGEINHKYIQHYFN